MAEVYCYGHVSTGKVLRLKDRYPPPDGYAEVAEILENHAGEATGTALVLARWGISVALEGNWIGDIPECRRTLEFLRERGVTDTYVLGLATDYCVKATALDAVDLGFTTYLVADGCRGVDYPRGSVEKALAAMEKALHSPGGGGRHSGSNARLAPPELYSQIHRRKNVRAQRRLF
jgi:hypothetical protein